MAVETERKFLAGPGWEQHVQSTESIRQGYLSADPARVVRVRIAGVGGATLTIKGPRGGARRAEFEYRIPTAEAEELLDTLCLPPLLDKRRHTLIVADREWIVDEFEGVNAGLVLAELEAHDAESVAQLPEWVVNEVTTDPRYDNSYLVHHPFSTWGGSMDPAEG